MKIIVQKYGGSSLASVEKIKNIAKNLDTKDTHYILVVSAMGTTTDDLLSTAKQISLNPKRREVDMLLTAGERISMSLMSMALNEFGKTAISFTGSQCGIFTDNQHGNARITGLNPFRVEQVLKDKMICVIAGFQGVSPETKEITTLGRGGSDTTAVAIASHFKSPQCEFKKDVTGVQSADPKIVKNTKFLKHLNFSHMMNMTFWGCKILHFRSVELADKLNVPLHISHAEGKEGFTMIDSKPNAYEKFQVISVQSHSQVAQVFLKNKTVPEALKLFKQQMAEKDFIFPQILNSKQTPTGTELLFVSSKDQEPGVQNLFKDQSDFSLSTVSIICNDSSSSETLDKVLAAMENIKINEILFQTQTITLVVSRSDSERSIQALHKKLVE